MRYIVLVLFVDGNAVFAEKYQRLSEAQAMEMLISSAFPYTEKTDRV